MIRGFLGILRLLADFQVDFIVVGGVAANILGSARLTYDLDLVYRRSRVNLERLVRALAPVHPYLRGAPPGLPFVFDLTTLRNGLNFTLTIDLGALDLLGEVPGGRTYEELLPHTFEVEVQGVRFKCVGVERLIAMKNAAGRPKDFEAIAELRAIQEEQEGEFR